MKPIKHPLVILTTFILIIAIEGIIIFYIRSISEDLPIPNNISVEKSPVIIDSLKEGDAISSPMTLTGQARGTWFFEGSFPIIVIDWDGRIIGEGYVLARGDWMTEGFVPFEGVVSFEKPVNSIPLTYSSRGAVIFKKDNPSGLPEHDAAIEIPVVFK